MGLLQRPDRPRIELIDRTIQPGIELLFEPTCSVVTADADSEISCEHRL